jgi:hypothetical protein
LGTFLQRAFLGDIGATDIDAFINYIGEKDLSASRKNGIIKAGTKPLRWAFSKGKIEADPTRGHILFSGEGIERNILSPVAATAAFRVDWPDERAKLANMLAAVTGMRQGEILWRYGGIVTTYRHLFDYQESGIHQISKMRTMAPLAVRTHIPEQ